MAGWAGGMQETVVQKGFCAQEPPRVVLGFSLSLQVPSHAFYSVLNQWRK